MRARTLALATAAAAALAGPAVAFAGDGDGDLWIGPAAFVCLEQDGAYKSTPLGAALTSNPGYLHWREHEGDAVLACVAKKNLLPAALCTGIFRMDPKGDAGAAKALYDQYAAAIQGLERIAECDAPPAK